MRGKAIRLKDKTYEEVATLAEVTGFQQTSLLEMAWAEFKKTTKYAHLMLFGCNENNSNGGSGNGKCV